MTLFEDHRSTLWLRSDLIEIWLCFDQAELLAPILVRGENGANHIWHFPGPPRREKILISLLRK